MVDGLPTFGGTKNPQISRIVELGPDLVIANKEENQQADVEALQTAGLTVLLTDPVTVDDAFSLFSKLGDLFGVEKKAAQLIEECERLLQDGAKKKRPKVCVLVWKGPWMALGSETYGHALLTRCGFDNVMAEKPRYPEFTPGSLASFKPDLVLLPDEPYPFNLANSSDLAEVAPRREIDGRLLWWYGPRMPEAINKLRMIADELA